MQDHRPNSNIQYSGRAAGGGLHSAVRALRKSRVDVAVLQETKIAQARFAPRRYKGFTIRVAPSSGENCGGVALVTRENSLFRTENERVIGPNVILFEMVIAKDERWFVVGCYLPPSDKGGGGTAAVDSRPGWIPQRLHPPRRGRSERRSGLPSG